MRNKLTANHIVSPFKPSNKRRPYLAFRWSDIMVLFMGLSLAVLVSTGINSLHNKVQRYSEEEIRISDLVRQFTYLNAQVDEATLHQETNDLNAIDYEIRSQFKAIKENDTHSDLLELEKLYQSYLVNVFEQLRLVTLGRTDEALKLDEKLTDPAFDQLEKQVRVVDLRVESEKTFWKTQTNVLVSGCLIIGSLFSVWIFLRHKNYSVDVAKNQMKQAMSQKNEKRLTSIISNSRDIFVLADEELTIKMISDAVERLCGRKVADLIGTPLLELVHSEDAARLFNYVKEIPNTTDKEFKTEVRLVHENSEVRYFEVQLSSLLNDPSVEGILMTFHDLSERKEFEARLGTEAFYDTLTGLPNRALLMDRLNQRLKMAEQEPATVGVMFLDLDNFKVVNDSLGHEAGDRLLVAVAEHLQAILRTNDTLARWGGDEFVILLGDIHNIEMATMMASRIVGAFEQPLIISNREIFVTTSIGIALNTEGAPDAEGLLRDADIAMYQAKNNGKSNYVVFDRSMNEKAVERLELEGELRRAILTEQLELFFQPIVSVESAEIQEVEALIRWRHPERGIISPAKFIPIAEETGLICSIGLWVLREGCSKLQTWQKQFPSFKNLRMSINISGRQLQQEDFVAQVEEIFHEYAVSPKHIKLEVTESVMLNNMDRSRDTLRQLRDLGLRVAIDDFGTGYSSMSYLQSLPIDTLKIDRSFINSMVVSEQGEGIVRAIIAMAKTLGLDVTSEGIETPQQRDTLCRLGCEFGQGFLFSKPLSATGIASLLAAQEDHEEIRLAS